MNYMQGITNASQLKVKEEEEEKVMDVVNKECKVKQRFLGEVTEIILAKVSRLCQLQSNRRGFLSRLSISQSRA
jgi:hypothetical protein